MRSSRLGGHARGRMAATLLTAALLAGCAGTGPSDHEGGRGMTERRITDVLVEHAPRLMRIEGVTAVYEAALDDGTPCIKVLVVKDDAALRAAIPSTLEGHPVVIEASGEIRAMPDGGS